MILRRRLLCLLLVGVGSVAVPLLLLLTSHQECSDIQEQRKAHLQEACSSTSWRRFEELSDSELRHFIVDDKHGIIYCFIPKVACTNWRRVFYVLKKGEPYVDVETIHGNFVHGENLFPLLNSYPMVERKARLKNYTKFLFVRDPLVRLISAYRNKFRELNQPYYKAFARYMLKRYSNMSNPPELVEEAFASGIQPPFHHFVQFLTDWNTERTSPFDYHWRQMHQLCHPCSIQYDFIGHQETLQEDADMLLKMVKLDHLITFPISSQIPNNATMLWDWYKAVPLEDRRALYKIYELDFQLFGYTKPHFLLDNDT